MRRINLREVELKEAKDEILKQRNFSDTLVTNLPMALFAKDVHFDDYKFVAFNKEAGNIFGMKTEDVLGKNDFDHFPYEEAKFFNDTDREVIKKGCLVKVNQENVTTAAEGTFIAQVFKMPIYDHNGEPILMLGLLQDATDRIKGAGRASQCKRGSRNPIVSRASFWQICRMSFVLR